MLTEVTRNLAIVNSATKDYRFVVEVAIYAGATVLSDVGAICCEWKCINKV